MIIDCQYQVVAQMPEIPESWLREEPIFYGRAHRVTGKIGRAFRDALPPEMRGPETDMEVRVRYLKKGWCSDGDFYHFDLCHERADGHADPSGWDLAGEHTILGSVGSVAFTRVLVGPVELPDIPLYEPQDQLWDNLIRHRVARGVLVEHTIPEGQLVRMGNVLHAPTPAIRSGIRIFLRARPAFGEGDSSSLNRPQRNVYKPGSSRCRGTEALLAAPYFPQRRAAF